MYIDSNPKAKEYVCTGGRIIRLKFYPDHYAKVVKYLMNLQNEKYIHEDTTLTPTKEDNDPSDKP